MNLCTGIRAVGRFFRFKTGKAMPVKTGRAAMHCKGTPPKTDEPDIMYLEDAPAVYDKRKSYTADEVVRIIERRHRRQTIKGNFKLTVGKKDGKHDKADGDVHEAPLTIKPKRRRYRRVAVYIAACLALVAGLLTFVMPEGGKAATEKIPAVVIGDNPRLDQINIDPSVFVKQKQAQVPDVPDVTTLMLGYHIAESAVETIDAATATPEPLQEQTRNLEPAPATTDELVSFFVDESGQYFDDAGYSTNTYEYTDDEVYLLAQVITSEARGETFEGMVAVGNVVMNRVLNTDQFGDTIASVVKSGQFAYSKYTRPTTAAKRAALAVLKDEYWVLPQDVYFFKSHSKAGKDWGRNEYVTKIKGHCFYMYPYSGRYTGEGIPPKLYERTYRYAQYGCTPSERVRRIQQMLNKIGFHVDANGFFDKRTRNALTLFQETNGLDADGIAAPDTIAALIRAYGFEAYIADYVTGRNPADQNADQSAADQAADGQTAREQTGAGGPAEEQAVTADQATADKAA